MNGTCTKSAAVRVSSMQAINTRSSVSLASDATLEILRSVIDFLFGALHVDSQRCTELLRLF